MFLAGNSKLPGLSLRFALRFRPSALSRGGPMLETKGDGRRRPRATSLSIRSASLTLM